jgi:peptidoglycan/LPS O-acetylase OafA/YrhL
MTLFVHPSLDESILTSKAQTKQNHELVGIEVLRFICAFAILIWHYQHFFFTGEYDKLQAEALFSMVI